MAGPVKQKTIFYTLFKNIPYTDSEWERTNVHRQGLSDNPRTNPRYKEKYHVLKTRPNHSFTHGPSAHSHEEARAICEKAIAAGAQSAVYAVYPSTANAWPDEQWTLRKGQAWNQTKRKY